MVLLPGLWTSLSSFSTSFSMHFRLLVLLSFFLSLLVQVLLGACWSSAGACSLSEEEMVTGGRDVVALRCVPFFCLTWVQRFLFEVDGSSSFRRFPILTATGTQTAIGMTVTKSPCYRS